MVDKTKDETKRSYWSGPTSVPFKLPLKPWERNEDA
jgi:hypothetical protein